MSLRDSGTGSRWVAGQRGIRALGKLSRQSLAKGSLGHRGGKGVPAGCGRGGAEQHQVSRGRGLRASLRGSAKESRGAEAEGRGPRRRPALPLGRVPRWAGAGGRSLTGSRSGSGSRSGRGPGRERERRGGEQGEAGGGRRHGPSVRGPGARPGGEGAARGAGGGHGSRTRGQSVAPPRPLGYPAPARPPQSRRHRPGCCGPAGLRREA